MESRFSWSPDDRAYGLRDYTARDIDGNRLTFGHYIYNVGEPIAIERVDVHVRLEKRLAALGDGVASPQTKAQQRHIQELKKKHGIDYDSHGSYRFVEKP